MIWNQTKETMSREARREMQGESLRRLVDKLYHNTPFYRTKMQQMGITPADIRTIEDIVKLPFTTKQDLRDNYPYGLFATPMSEIVRLHASTGTTGKPTVVGYTRRDLDIWAESIAQCLASYGCSRNDIFSVSYGYGLFTGGLGIHYGVERLGGTVIPVSTGNTAKHIQLMKDFGSTVLACTPSYALYLAEQIENSGIPRSEFKLHTAILGAEPWTENMRKEIESKLGVNAYNIYGLSEVMGPGVSHECSKKNGSHIIEEHYYPEIISPDTLEPLPFGTQGELVFTTLTKEGIPLLRYRTKDLCTLNAEVCRCGRTEVRMSRIVGRSDDMLIIRGVNVFPSQVESVILSMQQFEPYFRIIVDRVGSLDTMKIQVEVKEEFYSDEINEMLTLKKNIGSRIQSVLGISAEIKLMEPRSIERVEGKTQYVIDNRKYE